MRILSMADHLESAYETVNDWDPDLKNVLASGAGNQFKNSIMGSYLAEKGVGIILDDGKTGTPISDKCN